MQTYGLIGMPLSHSHSPQWWKRFFDSQAIEAEYLLYELESIQELPAFLRKFPSLRGLNITSPYKEQVLAYCDELDELARSVGAVNTIRIEWRDNKPYLYGYNTDVLGFTKSLHALPPFTRALILGTGGAARAVAYALKSLGVEVSLVSRQRRAEEGILSYADLPCAFSQGVCLLVNATPVGLQANEAPAVPYELIGQGYCCYDLIYNPSETAFIRLSKERGAYVLNGELMLYEQALGSARIWGLLAGE